MRLVAHRVSGGDPLIEHVQAVADQVEPGERVLPVVRAAGGAVAALYGEIAHHVVALPVVERIDVGIQPRYPGAFRGVELRPQGLRIAILVHEEAHLFGEPLQRVGVRLVLQAREGARHQRHGLRARLGVGIGAAVVGEILEVAGRIVDLLGRRAGVVLLEEVEVPVVDGAQHPPLADERRGLRGERDAQRLVVAVEDQVVVDRYGGVAALDALQRGIGEGVEVGPARLHRVQIAGDVLDGLHERVLERRPPLRQQRHVELERDRVTGDRRELLSARLQARGAGIERQLIWIAREGDDNRVDDRDRRVVRAGALRSGAAAREQPKADPEQRRESGAMRHPPQATPSPPLVGPRGLIAHGLHGTICLSGFKLGPHPARTRREAGQRATWTDSCSPGWGERGVILSAAIAVVPIGAGDPLSEPSLARDLSQRFYVWDAFVAGHRRVDVHPLVLPCELHEAAIEVAEQVVRIVGDVAARAHEDSVERAHYRFDDDVLRLAAASHGAGDVASLMRVDLLLDASGQWRACEINADCPGGHNEALGLPRLARAAGYLAGRNPTTWSRPWSRGCGSSRRRRRGGPAARDGLRRGPAGVRAPRARARARGDSRHPRAPHGAAARTATTFIRGDARARPLPLLPDRVDERPAQRRATSSAPSSCGASAR